MIKEMPKASLMDFNRMKLLGDASLMQEQIYELLVGTKMALTIKALSQHLRREPEWDEIKRLIIRTENLNEYLYYEKIRLGEIKTQIDCATTTFAFIPVLL